MLETKLHWQTLEVSRDYTHHLINQQPAYRPRFLFVLKFHEPGLASAQDASGAFHITTSGEPAYAQRFLRTFGFYEGRAAVHASCGWYHILFDGSPLYHERFAWCGNFQEHHCVVKDREGAFFHIDQHGKKAYGVSFRYVGDFHDGYAVVQNEQGLHTHIDFKGNILHGKWFIDLDVYHKGFARAKDEKGWFHINFRGNAIYKEHYKTIEPFYNGIARVETDLGAIYLIGESGEKVHILREAREDEFHQVSGELVSYWRFYTLYAANELYLFEHLPCKTKKLSTLLSISEGSLLKLLQALKEMGFVERSERGLWSSTVKGAFFHSQHPFSLRKAYDLWKDEHLFSWSHALLSLKTDQPAFNQLFGKGWFEWLKEHPEKNRLYHQALSIYAMRDYSTFCSLVDMSNHCSLLDLGGSSGILLTTILNHNPHLNGILLDLPNVIELVDVPSHLRKRIKCISSDFFEQWPPFTCESVILSRILHDWDDEKAVEILKKVHTVLTDHPDNRLYIIEIILDKKTGRGALLDLNMLIMTGGSERTLERFNTLLKNSGFILETIHSLNQVSSILVAKKKFRRGSYGG